MRKKRHKCLASYIVAVGLFAAALFCSGCVLGLATPTRHERKITAEYDLTEHTHRKILVVVNQPAWLNAQVNLRYYLTEKINENLTKEVRIQSRYLVSYDELSEFRSNRPDFSLLTPAEVGAALNADMVLFVMVNNYELNRIAEMGYYKGLLSVRSVLRDVATGEKLWPESGKSKSIKVGFDIESRGRKVAVARLIGGGAHCTVRYFYDCPEDRFKIADDITHIGW